MSRISLPFCEFPNFSLFVPSINAWFTNFDYSFSVPRLLCLPRLILNNIETNGTCPLYLDPYMDWNKAVLMWFNPVMVWMLRSPLHGFISKNTMLMTYTGRKSGRVYTIPMNYVRVSDGDGEVFLTTSYRQRTWWRNLRGGSPVMIRVQGEDLSARAEVVEDDEGVITSLLMLFEAAPDMAHYFEIGIDANGKPRFEDVARAAEDRVIVCTRLVSSIGDAKNL